MLTTLRGDDVDWGGRLRMSLWDCGRACTPGGWASRATGFGVFACLLACCMRSKICILVRLGNVVMLMSRGSGSESDQAGLFAEKRAAERLKG